MKIICVCFIASYFCMTFAYASEHDLPDVFKKLGYTSISYIPENLGKRYSLLECLEDKIAYYESHPIMQYDLSEKHMNEMDEYFKENKKREEKIKEEKDSIYCRVFGVPEKIKSEEIVLVENYLRLAELGYAPANLRLEQAFRIGDLGLCKDFYWSGVFADRECFDMLKAKEDWESTLHSLRSKLQRGESKYLYDSGNEEFKEHRKVSKESDESTASTHSVVSDLVDYGGNDDEERSGSVEQVNLLQLTVNENTSNLFADGVWKRKAKGKA